MPGYARRLAVVKLLRIALAAALAWGTVELLTSLGRSGGGAPLDEAALLARAPAYLGLETRALAAAWREQLQAREEVLRALRGALGAEPRLEARKAAAARALAQLDSGRREADLRDMAGLRPAARRLEYARRLRSLVKGTSIDPVALGGALGRLARERATDRARRREVPLVLDVFGKELVDWLAGGR